MTYLTKGLLTSALMAASALALLNFPASAHHSFSATFKSDAKITVEGVVTKYSFKNPHVLTTFEAVNDDGSKTSWVVEGSAATLMRRSGWSTDTFKVGDLIRVTGDSTHDGSPMVGMDEIVVLDMDSKAILVTYTGRNKPVFAGQEPENTGRREVVTAPYDAPKTRPDGSPNLSLVWAGALPGAGRPSRPDIALSAAGEKMQAAFILANDPQVFCDPAGLVRTGGTPHPFKITQTDASVEIEYEEYGSRRIIPVGAPGDKPVDRGVKTHFGDAIAYYDGDILVIETINLLENLATPFGTAISDQARVIERMKRVDDGKNGAMISYEMVVTDPLYLIDPITLKNVKTASEGYDMLENGCEAPLRPRVAASVSTSFYAASMKVSTDLAELSSQCTALADEVGIGGRGWSAHPTNGGSISAKAYGDGPWYNSRGILVAASTKQLPESGLVASDLAINARSEEVQIGEGEQSVYCFGTMPTSSQSRLASLKPAPEGAGAPAYGRGNGMGAGQRPVGSAGVFQASSPAHTAEMGAPNTSLAKPSGGSKTWLWALLGALVIGALGVITTRKKP